jgi:hypothetical protein
MKYFRLPAILAPIFLITAVFTANAELFPLGEEVRIGGGEGRTALDTAPDSIAASPLRRFLAVRAESGIFTFTATDIAGTIWGQRGVLVTPEVLINNTKDDSQRLPSVCAQRTIGDFVVVWEDDSGGNGPRVRGRLISGAGEYVSQEFDIDTGDGTPTGPALACILGNDALIAWTALYDPSGTSDIMVRFLDTAGEPVTEPVMANADVPGVRGNVHAASNGLGRMVVTWTETIPYMFGFIHSTRARMFLINGTTLGNEIVVHTDDGTVGLHSDSVAVVHSDATFTIFWSGEHTTGTVFADILARRFSANGQPLTDEVTVNELRDGIESQPAVAELPDGRMVVAWTSTIDGDGSGISARVLNSDLSPAGDEFVVNSTTKGTQEFPGVAADADGKVIIVWSSTGADGPGSRDVFAQRFDSVEPQCGAPQTAQPTPAASDCLYILQVAVGSAICDPECVCAPGGDLPASATDALICLATAVGTVTTDALNCPCGT